jgi:DNA-directed RNA polymerase specialized sigma24 family protein
VTARPDRCAAVWQALESKLEPALDQLAAGDREVILLGLYRHLTHAEIGRRLAISEAAATQRVNRALEKLRKVLLTRGVQADTRTIGEALLRYAARPAPAAVAAKLLRVA